MMALTLLMRESFPEIKCVEAFNGVEAVLKFKENFEAPCGCD
jgi:hypothetical protein